MIYLEHIPAAPLNSCIRMLWYTSAHLITHQRERVLPNGCVQIVLNLARDFLLDCPEDDKERPMAPSVVVGARSCYEIVHTSDMADLAGIVFEPGGFPPFAGDAADGFSDRNISLEDVWGAKARDLRDRLREAPTPPAKLQTLESCLENDFKARVENRVQARIGRNRMVEFALSEFARTPVASVEEVARQTGWSVRHFSQVFRERVGVSPKLWCRIQRFQRVVKQLHKGVDIRWSELALDCGYYDQSHFANDFRGFSGINPMTYRAVRTRWANHIPVE